MTRKKKRPPEQKRIEYSDKQVVIILILAFTPVFGSYIYRYTYYEDFTIEVVNVIWNQNHKSTQVFGYVVNNEGTRGKWISREFEGDYVNEFLDDLVNVEREAIFPIERGETYHIQRRGHKLLNIELVG